MPLNLLLIGHLVRVGLSMRSKPTPHVHLRGGSMDSRQAAEQCFNPRSVCWHRCQQRRPRPCAPNCYSTYSPSELVQGRRISALCFYNWRIDEGSLQVGCYMSVTKGVLCLSTMWLKLQSCGIPTNCESDYIRGRLAWQCVVIVVFFWDQVDYPDQRP
jgi:hypothetical protein